MNIRAAALFKMQQPIYLSVCCTVWQNRQIPLLKADIVPAVLRDQSDVSLACIDHEFVTVHVIETGDICFTVLCPGTVDSDPVMYIHRGPGRDDIIDQITVGIQLGETAALKDHVFERQRFAVFFIEMMYVILVILIFAGGRVKCQLRLVVLER